MSRRDRRQAVVASETPTRAAGRGRHAARRGAGLGRTVRRLVAPAVLAVLTLGVLTLGAFPTRTFLDQRHATTAAEAQLRDLDAANSAAQQEADALRTDGVIEQIARKEYGLAKPGEELYHVLPPAQDPVRVPGAWPFNGLGSTLER